MQRKILLAAVSTVALTTTALAADRTAQGIWADISGNGTYTFDTTTIYQYEPADAASYFTNMITDGPAVSCSGNATNCAAGNQPAPPAAPLASVDELSALINANSTQCDGFFRGGALSGKTYTRGVTIAGLNTKGNWTFTWTYTIAPTQATVDPQTAWSIFHENGGGGGIELTFNGQIAGQSVQVSSKFPAPGKFSYSLADSLGLNRVANLVLQVSDGTNTQTATPSSTIVKNAPGALAGDDGAVDFNYVTNAGTNGSVQFLKNGDARTILNTDVFKGNNNGGADGSALAYARMAPVQFTLGAGNYTLTLTGTVKGNGAQVSQTFGVQEKLKIIGQGCGVL
jgi:hypothetical protein